MSKTSAVKLITEAYPHMTARLREGELRITFRPTEAKFLGSSPEDLAYYTDDVDDALGTADAMMANFAQRYAAHGL